MGHSPLHCRRMKLFVVLLALLPYIQSLCLVQQCSSWWSSNKNNVTGVCAVLFDENCCKASDTFHSIRVGEKGKLCSTGSSLNPFSSCQGPRLDNDVESMIVMPGCKLEVWDDEDRYDQEKLVLEARNSPHWIEELNDDFDDLN